MSDDFYIPGPESPDSPPARSPDEPPERTGSHPITFVPAPFTMRPDPTYPQRLYYAAIDPASARPLNRTDPMVYESSYAPADFDATPPIERRAGSEPHTGWRRQNTQVDTRRISIPPALEVASLTFRERLPYPDRTIDEGTIWMPQPIVAPRRQSSEPMTRPEMRAVGPHTQDDYGWGWPDENCHHEFPRENRTRFAYYYGMEDPNETAAVPTANVLESIEVEGDPLVALRQANSDSQRAIRREIARGIELEEGNRDLTEHNTDLQRSWVAADDSLRFARAERDHFQRELNLARNQAGRLQAELEARPPHRRAQQGALGGERDGGTDLEGILEDLELANRRLVVERDSAFDRIHQLEGEQDRLQRERRRLEDDLEGLEMQRDHYQEARDLLDNQHVQLEAERDHLRNERDREQYQNQILQEQIQELHNRLLAAEAVAHIPSQSPSPSPASTHGVDPHPVVAPQVNPPLVVAAQIALPQQIVPPAAPAAPAAPAGPGRRGRGGREGRGRGGAVTRRGRGGKRDAATREQPKRACKVKKSYKG